MNGSINEICLLSLNQTQQHGQTEILLQLSEAIVRLDDYYNITEESYDNFTLAFYE
ncbi:unnamed protein product, partial [Rotaria magnacalcarata]